MRSAAHWRHNWLWLKHGAPFCYSFIHSPSSEISWCNKVKMWKCNGKRIDFIKFSTSTIINTWFVCVKGWSEDIVATLYTGNLLHYTLQAPHPPHIRKAACAVQWAAACWRCGRDERMEEGPHNARGHYEGQCDFVVFILNKCIYSLSILTSKIQQRMSSFDGPVHLQFNGTMKCLKNKRMWLWITFKKQFCSIGFMTRSW